jgi:hypothetical protein
MSELSWNEIRQLVYERANRCCEYCQTCEINTGQTMQVDQIDPHGGDNLENLCLSCWNCNNHKRQAAVAPDPETNEDVPLFNPRTQVWAEHFEWIDGAMRIRGRTPTGRATVVRLKMNRPAVVIARRRWAAGGYHPPD